MYFEPQNFSTSFSFSAKEKQNVPSVYSQLQTTPPDLINPYSIAVAIPPDDDFFLSASSLIHPCHHFIGFNNSEC